MLPYEQPTIFEDLARCMLNVPRVVLNQRAKFESDDLLKKCARESEVKYTGYKDRPRDEREYRFKLGLREGRVEVAYTAHGTNLQLAFPGCATGFSNEYCDFNKQPGRVYIRSSFIMNGVCVRWKGWLDLHKLEGMGCLEFDEERAKIEDAHLREQIEKHREKAFDSFRVDNPNPFPVHSKRSYRERIQGETDLSAHHIDVHRT
ncbi:core-binding factor subunit beta-like isoform X1 [Varroa jacobsoni]|uniref:Protein big brother n=1 Tax=Varroa destructor TaxID=109461 RepID=A0A7M7K6S9_VARDE|nr:core-binding factor subunit beta-like [Varroa destructor]XP_022661239.1 core-binding factor subunit beta-like [Varroa destructor]XP_022703838.1 core-binding factor subunit beta-like isoform X1 [Varroa jacobsoni]XP_022703839.1 core-binding factor subunit beta-like isoform X1 [Varroa jacobsoni]